MIPAVPAIRVPVPAVRTATMPAVFIYLCTHAVHIFA